MSEESKDVNSSWAQCHSCANLAGSLAMIAMDSYSSITISPNKSFFLQVVLVMMLNHRKVANTRGKKKRVDNLPYQRDLVE